MHRVTTFGNCQADALASLLLMSLPDSGYSVEFFSNNQKTGGMKSPEQILESVAESDILIFQPLDERHGLLCEESIRSTASGTAITFPYLFNSGISSFCHNIAGAKRRTGPTAQKRPAERVYGNSPARHSYGNIFGEEPIIAMLEAGRHESEIIDAYREGSINFQVRARFDWCLGELQRREEPIDIKIADHISRNYRVARQFLTHNHPTTNLLTEICASIGRLGDLPIDVEVLRAIDDENVADLPGGRRRCPVSPHDAEELGYEFGHDVDWLPLGSGLIKLICDEYRDLGSQELGRPAEQRDVGRPTG